MRRIFIYFVVLGPLTAIGLAAAYGLILGIADFPWHDAWRVFSLLAVTVFSIIGLRKIWSGNRDQGPLTRRWVWADGSIGGINDNGSVPARSPPSVRPEPPPLNIADIEPNMDDFIHSQIQKDAPTQVRRGNVIESGVKTEFDSVPEPCPLCGGMSHPERRAFRASLNRLPLKQDVCIGCEMAFWRNQGLPVRDDD